jgi:hypothetical protein
MRGFARRQEILSVYSGKTPMAKREKIDGNGYPTKWRNKIIHSKSISNSMGEIKASQMKSEIDEYDFSSYDPKIAEEIKNKR